MENPIPVCVAKSSQYLSGNLRHEKSIHASQRSSEINLPVLAHSGSGIECNMCGDVGFQEELFHCQRCFKRVQHRYCSRLYPNLLPAENWVCDWCICAEEKSRKQAKLKTRRAKVDADDSIGHQTASSAGSYEQSTLLNISTSGASHDRPAIKKRRHSSILEDSAPTGARRPWKCSNESTNSQVATSRGFTPRYKRLQDVLCAS